MRDVLIQQRAWVQHWIADLAAGFTPTRGSLEAALAALETHLTQDDDNRPHGDASAKLSAPRMHSDEEYCLYHNDNGQHIGACALEVRGWLEEHPDYRGKIWGDWDTGGTFDHFEATAMFFPEEEEDDDGDWMQTTVTSLVRKPMLALTDDGYVWVDVPVEVVSDTRGKIIFERFIDRNQPLNKETSK
jgi:hypothetical protein